MLSLSFMNTSPETNLHYDVFESVQRNRKYFRVYNNIKAEDVMEFAIFHAITHFSENRGNIDGYIRTLGRKSGKTNSKSVNVDFLEETVADDNKNREGVSQAFPNTMKQPNFVEDVLTDFDADLQGLDDMHELALAYMPEFMELCKAYIDSRGDIALVGEGLSQFSKEFQVLCKNLLGRLKTRFFPLAVDVYNTHLESMNWFLSYADEETDVDWYEMDNHFIQKNSTSRYFLSNFRTGMIVKDADRTRHYLGGAKFDNSRKKIVKVGYYDTWNLMCDMVDDDITNEMKFIMGNHYIVRTPAGSLSCIDAQLYFLYDNIRDELLTNVLKRIGGGKLIHAGSENFYIICNKETEITLPCGRVRGVPISFTVEDITGSIIS